MQALLLAAGLGTRLKPFTEFFPKCLAPIRGRPLLGLWLKFLVDAGVEKIFINVHYQAELVVQFIRESGYADKVQILKEENLLGTAGTLIKYRHLYNDEPLLLVHADNLSHFNFNDFYKHHKNRPDQTDISMMTFNTDTPSTCGIVEHDSHGRVLGFYEKVNHPPGNKANAAVYWIEQTLIQSLDPHLSDMSTEVIACYIDKISVWHNTQYHRDIGNMESLLQAQHDAQWVIEGPVTQSWRKYWQENDWDKLKKLFQRLVDTTKLPAMNADALHKGNREQAYLSCVTKPNIEKNGVQQHNEQLFLLVVGEGDYHSLPNACFICSAS